MTREHVRRLDECSNSSSKMRTMQQIIQPIVMMSNTHNKIKDIITGVETEANIILRTQTISRKCILGSIKTTSIRDFRKDLQITVVTFKTTMRGQNQIQSLHQERVIPTVQSNLPQLIIVSEDQSNNSLLIQDIR